MWSYRCVERGLSARDHRAPRGAQTPHGPLAARYLLLMPLTRDDIRESVERAGDEHWDALRRHHEDAYPNPKPTPGDVCKGEAERLNQLGLGDAKEFELLELLRITQSQLIQPLGLTLADVAGRGLRVGVGVFVVPAQGVPMLIAGALHRLADVVSGERHEEKVPRRRGSSTHR